MCDCDDDGVGVRNCHGALGLQAFLSQSEEERVAAEERETKAVSEAEATQQAVRDAEERLRQAEAELEV